jgi:hypothetical protein
MDIFTVFLLKEKIGQRWDPSMLPWSVITERGKGMAEYGDQFGRVATTILVPKREANQPGVGDLVECSYCYLVVREVNAPEHAARCYVRLAREHAPDMLEPPF